MSEKIRIDLTDEHFHVFEAECLKWVNRFGLKGWRVICAQVDREPDGKAAWLTSQYNQRIACISLPRYWMVDSLAGNEPTEEVLRRHAFHEVAELLLERIGTVAECRWVQKEELEEARHEVIRILENVVWQPEWKRRRTEEEIRKD